MVVRMPGTVPAGQIDSNTVWYFADVLPTMADMAGASVPSGIDGKSVWQVLKGEKTMENDRFLYWEFHERGFQQAVRWKNWKVVRLSNDAPLQLYDLTSDIGETQDIAGERKDIIKIFNNYLDTARTKSKYWRKDIEVDIKSCIKK